MGARVCSVGGLLKQPTFKAVLSVLKREVFERGDNLLTDSPRSDFSGQEERKPLELEFVSKRQWLGEVASEIMAAVVQGQAMVGGGGPRAVAT